MPGCVACTARRSSRKNLNLAPGRADRYFLAALLCRCQKRNSQEDEVTLFEQGHGKAIKETETEAEAEGKAEAEAEAECIRFTS